jgi:hypothetical protein
MSSCDGMKKRYYTCETSDWNSDDVQCDARNRKMKNPLKPIDLGYLIKYLFPVEKRMTSANLTDLKTFIHDMVIPQTKADLDAIKQIRKRLELELSDIKCTPAKETVLYNLLSALESKRSIMWMHLNGYKQTFAAKHPGLEEYKAQIKSDPVKDLKWLDSFVKYELRKGNNPIRFEDIKKWPDFNFYFYDKIDLKKLYNDGVNKWFIDRLEEKTGITVLPPAEHKTKHRVR